MTGIITQARINSSRLPNKIMLEAGGKSFLQHHTDRLARTLLPIIVATTDDGSEKPIINFCIKNDLKYYRGSESDVLKRFYEAAVENNLSTIIRVTSDCPLIDADIILQGLKAYKAHDDNTYYSNALKRTYPRGMDYEIFSFELLKEAYENAQLQSDREHVTPYIWNNRSGRVKIADDINVIDNSNYRVTLDTLEDRELITRLIEEFDAADKGCMEIVSVLKNNPGLVDINRHIEQKKV